MGGGRGAGGAIEVDEETEAGREGRGGGGAQEIRGE